MVKLKIVRTSQGRIGKKALIIPPCSEALREPAEEGWFIRFKDLEDLLKFVAEQDEVILTKESSSSAWGTLEIYDGRRE